MFTGIKKNKVQNGLAALPSFNRVTLSLILEKKGNNLSYWIKRLTTIGEIIPIKKNLFVGRGFVLKLEARPESLQKYSEYLAGTIRTPSYISLEYALARYGAITDVPYAITSITSKSSRAFKTAFGGYIYRNIKPALFCGYAEGLFNDKRYFIASRAKALFDLIYLRTFNAKTMETELTDGLRINWDVFNEKDILEFKKYAKLSGKKKMDKAVSIIIDGGLV